MEEGEHGGTAVAQEQVLLMVSNQLVPPSLYHICASIVLLVLWGVTRSQIPDP